MKQFVYLTFLVSILIACKQHTVDNSAYKNEILALDSVVVLVDTAHRSYEAIDKEAVHLMYQAGAEKFNTARAKYTSDTLIREYDYILTIFKGTYLKPSQKIKSQEDYIDKEYAYSKNQYLALRDNLIREAYPKDSALYYFNVEKTALVDLQNKIETYNSKVNIALNQYDSLSKALDTIVQLYGAKE